jgi:hypothetical protein
VRPSIRLTAAVLGSLAATAAVLTPAFADPTERKAQNSSSSNVALDDRLTAGAPGTLTVTPSNNLFRVDIQPGQTEYRSALLTNSSARDLDVFLDATVVEHRGDTARSEHLTIRTTRSTECSASAVAEAPSARLTSDDVLEQGIVRASQSVPICLAVGLSDRAVNTGAASVRADLRFDSIERADELAFTGAELSTLIFGAAAAALFGVALTRRRRPTTESPLTEPETEAP